MRKVYMNVSGRVQGVGFRYTTKMVADQLGVTGAVWNEADGSVGIEAVAEDKVLEDFITAVRNSPSPAGKVARLTIHDDPRIKERKSFDVSYPPQ